MDSRAPDRSTVIDAGSRPSTVAASTSSRSRALYVSVAPLVPPKLGPTRRDYHIAEQLSRFCDLSVVTTGPPEAAAAMQTLFGARLHRIVCVPPHRSRGAKVAVKVWRTASGRCDFLPVLEPALRSAVADLTRRDPYDAIVLSSLLLRGLPLPSDVPIVADAHNVEFDVHRRTAQSKAALTRRLYAACQGIITKREERRCAEAVDLVLTTSERDRQLFERELGLRRIAVIPNGVDPAEFSPSASPSGTAIVFTGLMSYYPNQHGIRWFLDAVFPRVLHHVPDARVVVAGAAPPRWLVSRRSRRIEVTGELHDLRPLIGSAGVVIAPLLIGGGTRVKILEAQAMGRPVVSTSVGAEGLEQRDGETILIGDDPGAFASHVVCLLTNVTTGAALARNGREHVVRHYDWNHIGTRLHHVLRTRIGLRGVSPVDQEPEADRPCAPTAASIAS